MEVLRSKNNESSPNTSITTKERASNPKWAYVFLLADVNPEEPSYQGILYNIFVSTYVLKHDPTAQSYSKADIVVMVQMSSASKESKLREESFLQRMGIKILYLEPPTATTTISTKQEDTTTTFYSLVLAKFHVLKLTTYTKVLFLDGDVLTLCNLDYLLALSEEGQVLKETVLHAMYEDPVNAGLFIVTPKQEYYDEVQDIIQRHGIPSKQENNSNWDPKVGWGDKSVDYRLWDMTPGKGWSFYCADADQGLLLYWARFVRKQVSIIVGPVIEEYSPSNYDGAPEQVTSSGALLEHSCVERDLQKHGRTGTFAANAGPMAASLPFYQDFFHMVGYSKAWELPPVRPVPNSRDEVESSSEYWYFLLQKVKDRFDSEKIIPPIEEITKSIPQPRIRGDLISVADGPDGDLVPVVV
ncbi:unnamed protein product [Cylindrotheca closterium]|uniref:Hexosyltransferase n=1 Tax=Cylindrotheca closterium TaxID=2856 RepID=A0AAD2FRX7_9STRA|nr:unnamed protein product [Cylindrotheca closterium]